MFTLISKLWLWFVQLQPEGSYLDRFFMNLAYAEEAEHRQGGSLDLSWWVWAIFSSDLIASRYWFDMKRIAFKEGLADKAFLCMLWLTDPLWVIKSVEEFARAYHDREKNVSAPSEPDIHKSALNQAISINEQFGNEGTPKWAMDLLRNNGLLGEEDPKSMFVMGDEKGLRRLMDEIRCEITTDELFINYRCHQLSKYMGWSFSLLEESQAESMAGSKAGLGEHGQTLSVIAILLMFLGLCFGLAVTPQLLPL